MAGPVRIEVISAVGAARRPAAAGGLPATDERGPRTDGLSTPGARWRRVDRRLVVAVWLVIVVAAVIWGTRQVDGVRVGLRATPFAGRWEWHGGVGLVPALVVGAAVVAWGPRCAARVRWHRVPLLTGLGATMWAAVLGAGDGWARLTSPLVSRHEYEPFAGRIRDLGGFLHGYVDRLDAYPIHVQGHPPGPVVVAWALDRIGLGGAGWLALLALLGWGAATAAAVVAAREVAGEASARRVAPMLVVLPAAVWAGTSMDGLFAGVIGLGVALAVSGAVRSAPSSRRSPGAPAGAAGRRATGRPQRHLVVAGVLLGVALLLTYGAVPLLLIPVALVLLLADRPATALGLLAVGIALPLMVAAAAGFGWFEGFAATRAAYWSGIAARRPAGYITILGNPAVLAVALGPAVVVGLTDLVAGAARTARRPPATVDPAEEGPLRATRLLTRIHATVHPAEAGPLRATRLLTRIHATVHPAEEGPLLAALLSLLALVAVLAADLSQYARGEVERIWLPFVPWLALAAGRGDRRWLAAQVGLALLLQSVLVSPW